MSVTVATRSAGTARLGSTITVGGPTGDTINQRLRGGLFGYADSASHSSIPAATAAAAHNPAIVRRMDGALNYTPIKAGGVDGTHPTLGQSGDYSYDWTIFNAEIDSAADEGIIEVYYSLDYTPQLLGGNLAPSTTVPFLAGWYRGPGSAVPNDLPAFATMCADFVAHAIAYAATKGIEIEYVGLWNEPDIFYFAGTAEDWIDMYAEVAPAVRAVAPSVKLGGPELANLIASTVTDWIIPWLTRCKADGIPADFASFHMYDGHGWDIAVAVNRINGAIAEVEWETPLDIIVGEYAGATLTNFPGNAPPFSTDEIEVLSINDQSAAMTALQMIEMQHFGVARAIFFHSYSLPVTGLSGLANAEGPTAAGNVFNAWALMGDADVLTVDLAADPGIFALAAEGEDGTIYVLLVSHHYRLDPTYPVTVELPGANGRATTLYGIDRDHSNQWNAGVENAELQEVAVADVAGQRVRLTMQGRSVCLLEIAP